jgi:cysteine desulfurase family protein
MADIAGLREAESLDFDPGLGRPLDPDEGRRRSGRSVTDAIATGGPELTIAASAAEAVAAEATADDGVYLDNAATSFPKPEAVYRAMDQFSRRCGGSGGRSGHSKSLDAARYIDGAREALCELLGGWSPESVCFTLNATDALNMAIQGLAPEGGRVVTTSVEHNAVWRPVMALKRLRGCEVTVVEADADGRCPADRIVAALRGADLVAMGHASNVTGAVQDVAAVAGECRRHGVPLVVDASQTAGCYPIDAARMGASVLAFTGHKSLLGPQGTGGFLIDPELAPRMRPLRFGGTGVYAELEDQPSCLPEKFESGTLNGHGLAGLEAGARFLLDRGVRAVRDHEMSLWQRLRDGLSRLPRVRLFGPSDRERSVALVSLVVDGMQPTDVGFLLDARFGIMTRTGLHCSPAAHRTIGTMPAGTIRFSIGWSSTIEEIDLTIDAFRQIVA